MIIVGVCVFVVWCCSVGLVVLCSLLLRRFRVRMVRVIVRFG